MARLLLADFDRDVTAIAAPFLLQARVAGIGRRHVPDFLLAHADGSVRVVNVKPAGTPDGAITVGTRPRFDGGLWEVTELTAPGPAPPPSAKT
jgi:hypothetical protein